MNHLFMVNSDKRGEALRSKFVGEECTSRIFVQQEPRSVACPQRTETMENFSTVLERIREPHTLPKSVTTILSQDKKFRTLNFLNGIYLLIVFVLQDLSKFSTCHRRNGLLKGDHKF